jgi:RND family efflux transporter MFP subunit
MRPTALLKRYSWLTGLQSRFICGSIGLSAVAAATFVGCTKPPAPPAFPPATVTVSTPVQREVIEWDIYTGHLEAPQSVNVNAQVSGMLVAAPFTEGSVVKKDQVLFEIDPRPFKADLDSKEADLAKSKAQVEIAQLNFEREKQAFAGNAVSKQDYDTAKANLEQAIATANGSQAALDTSRLNLGWCHVTSPIAGRVSYKNVTIGNLVFGGAAAVATTLLTTVESVDPMYCYVDVDENSVLKYQKLAMERKRYSSHDGRIPCYLQLGNESGFPHEGYIDFVDNHVDTGTGTLKARGIFPNRTGDLTPGFFASMRVPGSGRYQALLVPDSAILTDQDRRNVLVVGSDNMVQVKQVQLGALFGGLRAISSGIGPTDRVIINGQMHARPGAPVAPVDGKIDVNPTDFAESADAALPGEPSSATTEPAAAATADAASAAAELHQMENESAPTTAGTQPDQPIMQYAKPSPNDVTVVNGTDFSAPASEPANGGVASGGPTSGPVTQETTMPATMPSMAPGSAGATTGPGAGQ